MKRTFTSAAIVASLCCTIASADAQTYYARQRMFTPKAAQTAPEAPADTTRCAVLTPKNLSSTVSGPKPRLVSSKYGLLNVQQAIEWCNSAKPVGMKGSCTLFMSKTSPSGTAWLYEDLSTEPTSDGDYYAANCS